MITSSIHLATCWKCASVTDVHVDCVLYVDHLVNYENDASTFYLEPKSPLYALFHKIKTTANLKVSATARYPYLEHFSLYTNLRHITTFGVGR